MNAPHWKQISASIKVFKNCGFIVGVCILMSDVARCMYFFFYYSRKIQPRKRENQKVTNDMKFLQKNKKEKKKEIHQRHGVYIGGGRGTNRGGPFSLGTKVKRQGGNAQFVVDALELICCW